MPYTEHFVLEGIRFAAFAFVCGCLLSPPVEAADLRPDCRRRSAWHSGPAGRAAGGAGRDAGPDPAAADGLSAGRCRGACAVAHGLCADRPGLERRGDDFPDPVLPAKAAALGGDACADGGGVPCRRGVLRPGVFLSAPPVPALCAGEPQRLAADELSRGHAVPAVLLLGRHGDRPGAAAADFPDGALGHRRDDPGAGLGRIPAPAEAGRAGRAAAAGGPAQGI